MMNPQDKD